MSGPDYMKARVDLAEDNAPNAPISEPHTLIGDIIEGTASHSPTVFERKAALVNAYVSLNLIAPRH